MPTQLSVNVNKVATIRNTRALDIPNVVHCAKLALDAGAHGITIHPRPDHRHIRPNDVDLLAAFLKTYPRAEFNIEGNPFIDYLPHIQRVRPTQCTLVPDDPDSFTSDRGWKVAGNETRLREVIAELKGLGARVSVFMDADSQEFELVREMGADRIELYTEPYAAEYAKGGAARDAVVKRYADAARRAQKVGLGVNAGHDLNLHNLPTFVRAIPGLLEVSIGHALIADALEFGLAETVRKYLAACAG